MIKFVNFRNPNLKIWQWSAIQAELQVHQREWCLVMAILWPMLLPFCSKWYSSWFPYLKLKYPFFPKADHRICIDDIMLSYLPLAHMFERNCEVTFCTRSYFRIHFRLFYYRMLCLWSVELLCSILVIFASWWMTWKSWDQLLFPVKDPEPNVVLIQYFCFNQQLYQECWPESIARSMIVSRVMWWRISCLTRRTTIKTSRLKKRASSATTPFGTKLYLKRSERIWAAGSVWSCVARRHSIQLY